MRWLLALAIMALGVGVDTALAGQRVIGTYPAEKRVALVIGNSTYERVGHLPNPSNDAADIAAALRRIGFKVRKEIDLDSAGLRRALRDFGDEASGADMAAIFFAGHGIEIDKQNYLIPTDARLKTDKDLPLEAIPLDHFVSAVDGAKGLRLVLVDACRNNPFQASMKMTSAKRSIGRGLARVDPSGGVLVGFAAKEGTVADDGNGRNSPYTAALLANLEKPGLEIRFLFGRVHDSVMDATAQAQEPFMYGALGGDPIYLVPPSDTQSSLIPPPPPEDEISVDFKRAKRVNTRAVWDEFIEKHRYHTSEFYLQVAKLARSQLVMSDLSADDDGRVIVAEKLMASLNKGAFKLFVSEKSDSIIFRVVSDKLLSPAFYVDVNGNKKIDKMVDTYYGVYNFPGFARACAGYRIDAQSSTTCDGLKTTENFQFLDSGKMYEMIRDIPKEELSSTGSGVRLLVEVYNHFDHTRSRKSISIPFSTVVSSDK
jgi:hypothetical protein